MASNAVRSLLRQSAQEYDLLFPEGGLQVPGFLLKDGEGELLTGWRNRFENIVANEWEITAKVFSERSYGTVVEIRDQLRQRLGRLEIATLEGEEFLGKITVAVQTIRELENKNDAAMPLRDALGEASPRSNAGKIGWSFNKDEEVYSLRSTNIEGRLPRNLISGAVVHSEGRRVDIEIEFASDASLELVRERLQEYISDSARASRQAERSRQLCAFKLQVMDAMLWQYEMFGELVGLTSTDMQQAADRLEELEMSQKRHGCNVPALRAAWEWMLSNRKRCWDGSGRPNRRAIWQTILLDPAHSKSLIEVSGPEKGRSRISSETADRYMERFEKEVGAEGLAKFQRSLGMQA